MGSKMLIDATHPEETRVVVSRGNRIEEFDFESAARKQLKGNIYLAKVTRVEPSLQAAFVDYGGNRHGFLAFSEIHPDYYQIPVADRQALLREQEEDARREDEENGSHEPEPEQNLILSADETPPEQPGETNGETPPLEAVAHPEHGIPAESSSGVEVVEEDAEAQKVESVGAEDALEEVPQRPRRSPRRVYKIQEVIKRRQIILVQVVKEERGNKGAALTTYLSLAGRYCVLMPNTARGGGISRKITDASDRRRLKEVARDIEIPEGMGLIVRTAGAQRTKTEIKRDYDYLIRLWETVRDLTLQSQAPALVYEEGSLIKRAIRDLYTKDVDEVLVEGDGGYREAKDFMKMLMPSHAKNVKLYKETKPLFSRHQIETQLDSLFSPQVTLQSGGYMVINQTEALVSIDINSGKATREHNIEDTALRTNQEAAEEIARQLRLRDLAGLIVIDFIDMEEKRNNKAVERRMKEALKNDRARIQVGRISHFGLLEMSRQRLRPGLLEGTTRVCPHCEGRGIVRSIASCTLSVLRAIEDHLMSKKPENLTVKCHPDVAVYILNEKRDHLLSIEAGYGVSVFVVGNSDIKGSQAVIERAGERIVAIKRPSAAAPVKIDSAFESADEIKEVAAEDDSSAATEEEVEARDIDQEREEEDDEQNGHRRRRRGRRGGRRNRGRELDANRPNQPQAEDAIPGLGEQPSIAELATDVGGDEAGAEVAKAGEALPTEPLGGNDEAEEQEQRRDRRRGRRDRWGRDRKRDRDQPRGRREAKSEEDPAATDVAPSLPEPVPDEPKSLPAFTAVEETAHAVEEAQPRKWTPPPPTTSERPAQAKVGWWSRRA